MFDQSLYSDEPAATPQQEGGIFQNYEIRNWDIGSRIYKILGISAVTNVVALLVIAQTSLLTMKGCDSPLVGRVCQVLDTVYVGSMLFGTDREYVDAVYDKTELGDAEITYVDVTGVTPPLDYPEGYFQLANPDQFLAMNEDSVDDMAGLTSGIPGIPSGIPVTPSTGGSLLDTKPNVPSANPNSVDGDLPGSFDSHPNSGGQPVARLKKPRNRRPAKAPTTGNPTDGTAIDGQVAEVKPSPTPIPEPTVDPDAPKADKNGVIINRRPLRVYSADAQKKIGGEKVNLDAPFSATIFGEIGLSKDGNTVVLKNTKPLDTKGDAGMIKLAQDGILAVGDSGWFGYLHRFDIKKATITIVQTDTEFKAVISADQLTEERARQVASGMNALIVIGRSTTDGDEKYFLDNANTTSEGKTFMMNFLMPKQIAIEMIKRKLEEPPKIEGKPTGNATPKMTDNTAKQ